MREDLVAVIALLADDALGFVASHEGMKLSMEG